MTIYNKLLLWRPRAALLGWHTVILIVVRLVWKAQICVFFQDGALQFLLLIYFTWIVKSTLTASYLQHIYNILKNYLKRATANVSSKVSVQQQKWHCTKSFYIKTCNRQGNMMFTRKIDSKMECLLATASKSCFVWMHNY